MRKALGIVLVVAFIATVAMGTYVIQSQTRMANPALVARMHMNNHLTIQDVTRNQLGRNAEFGAHHSMDLRPVDKRAIKLVSVKNARKIAAQGSH